MPPVSSVMAIVSRRRPADRRWSSRSCRRWSRSRWPPLGRQPPHVDDGRGVSALATIGLEAAGDDVALDELALLLGGLAERGGGEAVDVPHGAEGSLVQQADR